MPGRSFTVWPQGGPFNPIVVQNPLPNAEVTAAYSFQFNATAGLPGYSWTAAGLLGTGYSLASSGLLSGAGVSAGTIAFTVTVKDATGAQSTANESLTVIPGPSITTTTLPNASTGTAYTFPMAATGGTPPYHWAITSDTPDTGAWLTINSATGVLSGTPGTAETESLTIVVTDALSVPSAPTNFTLTVTGVSSGQPQALWLGNFDSTSALVMAWPPIGPQSANGVSGTLINFTTSLHISSTVTTGTLAHPINPGYYTFTMAGASLPFFPENHNAIVAADGVSVTFTTNLGSAVLQNSGPGGVAQALYDAVDSYNYYRNGVRVATGVLGNDNVSTGSLLQPWFCDIGLTPNTTYTYTARAVLNGVESADSPPVTVATLTGTGASVPPTAPTDPATYLKPNTPPVGGTTFVCNTAADVVSALSSANINGGDILKCTSGNVFAFASSPGFTLPAFTGANPTWIVCTQAPEINGAGTLIPYISTFAKPADQNLTLTAAPAANATSAVLAPNQAGLTDSSGNWIPKSGIYPTAFFETANSTEEQRYVSYTKGSSAISWSANLNSTNPLANACNAGVRVAVLPGVTPCATDLASMAVFQMNGGSNGIGFAAAAASKNVRFVGIWFQPKPTAPQASTGFQFPSNSFGSVPVVNPDHIYFDRCIIGTSTADPNYAYITHGFDVNCDHFVMNQSYVQGIVTFTSTASQGGDANGVFVRGGGPGLLQNSYLEASDENFIAGGAPVFPSTNLPHDYVTRGCFFTKPLMWLTQILPPSAGVSGTIPIAFATKNHYEIKEGLRFACYNNNHWNSYPSKQQGQFGIYNIGPLEQGSAGQQPITMASPWSAVTDIDVHDNDMWNCQRLIQMHQGDVCATGKAARYRLFNNVSYENPAAQTPVQTGPFQWVTTAWVPDFIIDHNTQIVNALNPANSAPASQKGIYNTAIGVTQNLDSRGVQTTPNNRTNINDRGTVTNNIIGGNWAIYDNSHHGTAAFTGAFNGANSVISGNLFPDDPVAYPAGNANNVAYTTIGFNNWNPAAISNAIGLRPSPGDWNVVSGTYATFSTTGGPIGAIINTTNAVTITTLSLANAAVGTDYQTLQGALAASGGSGQYVWNIESSSPGRHLWLKLSSGGAPYGIPQCDNLGQFAVPETVVIRCTDAANPTNTATATFNITITNSGSTPVITSPATLPNATQNGAYVYQLLCSGGQPPYCLWKITAHTGSNSWFISSNGWLYGVPTALSTDTVTVTVTDIKNATSTAFTVTIQTTAAIQMVPVDFVNKYPGSSVQGVIKLPPGNAGRKYQHQLFKAIGGTGAGQVYTLTGSLPAGLSMSATGKITGTPTGPGNANCSISVTDSGSNTTTSYPVDLNIAASSVGARPANNTGTGFFVDTTGLLCDPSGKRFQHRGINQNNPFQATSAWPVVAPSSCRFGLYTTDFRGTTAPGSPGGSTMSTYTSLISSNHLAVDQFTLYTTFVIPGTLTALSGNQAASAIGTVSAWYADNYSTWHASGLEGNAAINIANEWGPPPGGGAGASTVWRDAYAAAWSGGVQTGVWKMPVQSVNTSTGVITLAASVNDAANPLAAAAAIGYVYFGGGGINKAIAISTTTGGSSGAWTVTASNLSDVSGWTSGGTISGGALGIMRASGYVNDPLYIDPGGFGQAISDLTTYAVTVGQTDPLQNVVFSLHAYGTMNSYIAAISGVTKNNNTNNTISVTSTSAHHPFDLANFGINANPVYVAGVQGMTQMNGQNEPTNSNGVGGASGAWTVPIAVNTSTFGTYTGGGICAPGGSSPFHNVHRMAAFLASLAQSGIGFQIGEYGPQANIGASTTWTTEQEVIEACEAYSIPWIVWAMDDTNNLTTFNGNPGPFFFGLTGTNNNNSYSSPASFQASGIDRVYNPRYGLHCLGAPAPAFL